MEPVKNREELIIRLKNLKPILANKFGIEEFGIFGSFARAENTESSDVDIAIFKMRKKDFFLLLQARDFLSENLGRDVDLGTFDSIREYIKKEIIKEIIYV